MARGPAHLLRAVITAVERELLKPKTGEENSQLDHKDSNVIMVKLVKEGSEQPISDAIGKIKVIGPDKSAQISPLMRYGDFLEANFTFDTAGKYGVIWLFVENGQKQVVKFRPFVDGQ